MDLLKTAVLVGEGLLAVCTTYLLILLAAACWSDRRRYRQGSDSSGVRFVVLIPAHDEQGGILRTLQSVKMTEYPDAMRRVVVVADNCTDRTGELARAAGATVYERSDTRRTGKGYALAWGLQQLRAEKWWSETDAVVFLDADCEVSPNMLSASSAAVEAGHSALQLDNVAANPAESWVAALRYAAFGLVNTVRQAGKAALRLPVGMRGTGMVVTSGLLERCPWEAFSLAEDQEYGMRLAGAGEQVYFLSHAFVQSPVAADLRSSASQQMRWEGGRLQLIRHHTLPMVVSGLLYRDAARLHAGLEPLVPPQAVLVALNTLSVGAALLIGSPVILAAAAFNALGQAVFVLGGLVLLRAPRAVYTALLMAPVLVAWKLGLWLRIVVSGVPNGWARADRQSSAAREGGKS